MIVEEPSWEHRLLQQTIRSLFACQSVRSLDDQTVRKLENGQSLLAPDRQILISSPNRQGTGHQTIRLSDNQAVGLDQSDIGPRNRSLPAHFYHSGERVIGTASSGPNNGDNLETLHVSTGSGVLLFVFNNAFVSACTGCAWAGEWGRSKVKWIGVTTLYRWNVYKQGRECQ